jgi:hypothetical protein
MDATITTEERNWAAIAHASTLASVLVGVLTGGVGSLILVLVPLAIYAAFQQRSRYVAFQALQALAFQLAALIAYAMGLTALLILTVVAWVMAALLTIVLVGVVLMPVALAVTLLLVLFGLAFPLAVMLYGLQGAVESGRGAEFRYRWIGPWLEQKGVSGWGALVDN